MRGDVGRWSRCVDYGIGNLHSAQKALRAPGRRRPAHRRRRPDRRRRRRRAARRRRVRRVHGRAARRAASRSRSLDAVASGRPFLGDLRRHADAVRRAARRIPAPAGSACIPGTVRWIPPGVKRPQMQWNRRRRRRPPTTRCSPGSASEPWFYFVHSLHGVPDDPSVVVAHVRLRRHGQRRVPRRQRVRRAVPPREVGARRPRRCSATSSRVARRRRRRDRPCCTRRSTCAAATSCACARATTTARRVYGDDPVAVGAVVLRRRARRGSTSSTSTPPAPGEPVNRPVVAAIAAAVAGRAPVQTGGGVRTVDDAAALADAGVARVVMGSAAVRRPGARRRRRRAIVPVAVGLDHRGGELAVHGWTESQRRRSSPTRSAAFPAAAAFVITDIDRDGMLGGPDVDGLAAAVAATDDAGDRQRGRRRRSTTSRALAAIAGLARDHHRAGAVRGPLHASPRRWPRRGAGVMRRPRHPVPRRHRRARRQGHQLRRPARRRRPGRAGRALRRRGRRRARVPRHHGVERRPRHDGRHGVPDGRAGVHPVHRRRRDPHASRTPGGCCAPAPTRSASTPPRSQRPELIAEIATEFGAQCVVCAIDAKRAARRRVRGLPARRAHADRHRRRRVGGRGRGAGRRRDPAHVDGPRRHQATASTSS